jgi:quercetin dioxygenase-like cupin family protein
MHRTLSLDYCVVLSGSIWITLDSGDETEVKTGETILQRGTNHLWSNRSDVPCRVLFVMVGSDKVRLEDGTELEATKIGAPAQK